MASNVGELSILSMGTQALTDFLVLGFRRFFGFLIAHSLINTHLFLDWILEITCIDYLMTKLMHYLFSHFFSQELNLELFKLVCIRMLSAWLISIFLNQSLLILLFSEALYSLYTIYSQIFSKYIVESLSFFYFFSSRWLLLPVIINVSLTLVGVLDLFLETDFFFKLFNFRLVKFILEEWGINIPQKRNIKSQINQFSVNVIPPTAYPGLSDAQNLNVSILKGRYLQPHTQEFIQVQWEALKNALANQYYEHPSSFSMNDKTFVLPLEWDEFAKFNLRFSTKQQLEMFELYLNNEYHSAWRFLNSAHPWLDADLNIRNQKKKIFESEYLEFILAIWLAIQNQSQDRREIKVALFIKLLARVNRLGNYQEQLNMITITKPDKPGKLEYLFPNLLSLVSEKYSEEISSMLVKHLLSSFAYSIWMTQLLKLEIEDKQILLDAWAEILKNNLDYPKYHDLFMAYNFSKPHRDDFILKMNTLFGSKWIESDEYLMIVDSFFVIDTKIHSHPYVNQDIFSSIMVLIKKELRDTPGQGISAPVFG